MDTFFSGKSRNYLIILGVLAFGNIQAQTATVVKFARLESILATSSTEIQIVNFWATWCGPCVKELPYFQSLEAKHDKTLKITLVNLDYADKVDKVNAFILKNKLASEVLLLDETDYNAWIDKVDKNWSGALPATLFLNTATGRRKFVENELKEEDIEKYILEVKK